MGFSGDWFTAKNGNLDPPFARQRRRSLLTDVARVFKIAGLLIMIFASQPIRLCFFFHGRCRHWDGNPAHFHLKWLLCETKDFCWSVLLESSVEVVAIILLKALFRTKTVWGVEALQNINILHLPSAVYNLVNDLHSFADHKRAFGSCPNCTHLEHHLKSSSLNKGGNCIIKIKTPINP